MNELEKQTIVRLCAVAKKVCLELRPEIDELNVIYDSSGGVKDTVNQAKLDAEPGFSGLTEQQLDDGAYAITNTLRTAITAAYSQLATISARA